MSKHNYSQYSNKKNYNKNNTTLEAKVEIQNGVITDDITEGVGNTNTDVTVETIENKSVTDMNVTVETIENKTTTETNSGTVATGVITNCAKLNVRSKPDVSGAVVTVINSKDEVSIDVDKSTEEWFKIRTADGVKGYCMKKFVSANI